MLKNIKSMFNEETEYLETENIELEDETEDTSFDINEVVNSSRTKSIVKIYEPINRSSTQEIIDSIRKGELCVVNFSKVNDEEAKLIYSTLSGSLYSLDGTLRQVSNEIILCAPKNFLVDGEDID